MVARKGPMPLGLLAIGVLLPCLLAGVSAPAQTPASTSATNSTVRDGGHDFDFIIGDWKAHVRRLPERLVGSHTWIEYDGISRHKKILDSNANFEEFEVWSADKTLHLKAQTLRLYDPQSHQWRIYLVDVGKGSLGLPPVVGQFNGRMGEFYDQEEWQGRAILVRYQWTDISPRSAKMQQAFSADGGKSWEVNWICELSR
jgi:hypothetical protein